jgi:hypothetical protein
MALATPAARTQTPIHQKPVRAASNTKQKTPATMQKAVVRQPQVGFHQAAQLRGPRQNAKTSHASAAPK